MSDGTLEVLQAAAQWLQYLGTFLVIGAAVQRWAVLPVAARSLTDFPHAVPMLRHRAARAGFLGAVLLLVAALARLALQGIAVHDPDEPLTMEFLGFVLSETTWGRGWMTQAVSAGMAGTAFVIAWIYGRLGWLLVLVAATAVALAGPLTGHATGSAEAGRIGYPLDLLHLLAGGSWLGTLLVLSVTGLWVATPNDGLDRHRLVQALVRGFSPVALVAGLTAMAAGLLLAWRYLDGSIAALVTSVYGRVLLAKLAALMAVAGVGAWNWRIIRPRLGDPEATDALGRSSAVELGFSVVLLAITAFLVALPMPGDVAGP